MQIKSGDIVFSRSSKRLFLHLPHYEKTGMVSRLSRMLVLFGPLSQTFAGEKCLMFIVFSCEGIGWVRIVDAKTNPSIESGYLTLIEQEYDGSNQTCS